MAEVQKLNVNVGDTRRKVVAYLKQATDDPEVSVPVDLSAVGTDVTFRMVNARGDHDVKVDDEPAAIEDVATAKVTYTWNTDGSEIDEKGEFWAWFTVSVGGLRETFPTGYSFLVVVNPIDGTDLVNST